VIISVALFPLLLLGMATGLDRFMRRLVLSIGLIALAVIVIGQLFARRFTPGSETETAQATIQDDTANQIMTIGLGTLMVVGMIVAVVVLAAIWMRRSVAPPDDVEETRTIDASRLPERIRRRSRWTGLRTSPRTAVEAYVALVDDLERRPDARREVGETPAAHAARMRGSGRSGLGLDLLAADYGLARFGDVALSDREDARGVERWRRLRRSLVRSRPGTGAMAADPSVPIAGSEAPEGPRTGLRAG
ncbi:MAG: DUF4129 domain-containing protein, partial [Chloroflexota bacterium]